MSRFMRAVRRDPGLLIDYGAIALVASLAFFNGVAVLVMLMPSSERNYNPELAPVAALFGFLLFLWVTILLRRSLRRKNSSQRRTASDD